MHRLYLIAIVAILFPGNRVKPTHKIAESKRVELNDIGCSLYDANGVQHCTVGILSDNLSVIRQNHSEWCWAASISAVFTYYGHRVSQERIVRETFGTIENVPGQPDQIYQALNRNWTDDAGNDFTVTADVLSANAATAIQDLSNNFPLIVGTLGHAMVLTYMEYNHDVYDRIAVTLAAVRDPWPYSANRRVLSPQEFYNISFLARIRVD